MPRLPRRASPKQRSKTILEYFFSFGTRPRIRGWGGLFFLPLLFVFLLSACEDEEESPGEPEKYSRVYEFNEKYIIQGITNFLKEKDYKDPKVDYEKGKVETDFIVVGNMRTRVEATVKKIGQREREVTLEVTTEKIFKKIGWRRTKILGKEQYDRFFDEIEMQIYRELAKPELKEGPKVP